MPYFVIENFTGGLDSRRFLLTAPAGTLRTARNVVLTRGGEIEIRKAFVESADLTGLSTHGFQSTANGLYTFGSVSAPTMPGKISYQRLQHPGGASMVNVVYSTVFEGKAFVIAEFSDGMTLSFYDGTLISDFSDGVVRADMTDNEGIAEHLRDLIEADSDYSASYSSNVITISAAAGVDFTVSATAENGGLVDDQTATVATTQVAIDPVAEVLSSGSVELTGGSSGDISSVTVNGVTVTSGAVTYANSLEYTAQLLVDNINAYTSTPNYTATRSGAVVTIRAAAGTGATPNGYVVASTVTGTLTKTDSNMAGGVTAISGRVQQSTVTIGGTFDAGDKFTISLTTGATTKTFGAGRVAGITPTCAVTLQDKVYLAAGDTVYFCDVADPTNWETGNSGFIVMSNQYGGSEDVSALGVYQNNLAVFSRRFIQIWFVDPDPDLNRQLQVLPNIGTLSALSVVSYGDSDSFFLADSGIRGLRARDSSNNASVNDIGTPVDVDVVERLQSLSEAQKARACGVLEPVDGRFWISMENATGTSTVYVFSFFPGSRVSAWSTFELPFWARKFELFENSVYVRGNDDKIYRYGGASGSEYDDDESETSKAVVELPWLSAGKPGTSKTWTGIDAALQGTWELAWGTDTSEVTARENAGTLTESTFNLANIGISGVGSHGSLKLTHVADGEYARIGMLIFHFKGGHAE